MASKTKIPRLPRGIHSGMTVLRMLRDIIKEEPLRLDMVTWMLMFAGTQLTPHLPVLPEDTPACGTVACAAGWINILTGHERENRLRFFDPGKQACRHLGLDVGEDGWGRYRSPLVRDLTLLFDETAISSKDVCARLLVIMREHSKELLASRVVVK